MFISATIVRSADLMASIKGQGLRRAVGDHRPGEQSPAPSWKGLKCLVAQTSKGAPAPTHPEPSRGLATPSSSSSEVSWSRSIACQWGSESSEALFEVRVSMTFGQKSWSTDSVRVFLFFAVLGCVFFEAGSSVGRITVSSITTTGSRAGGKGGEVRGSARGA